MKEIFTSTSANGTPIMHLPASPRLSNKMRSPRQRPTSQHGASSKHSQQPGARPPRKVFNCIVDESALVAGVKRSTRNGIRQWVKNGQIRLFVPLHALDQLSRLKNNPNRHGEDVRETLQWLDDATSLYPNYVTLQGADETFERWADVATFAVPRTLFSENDIADDFEPELGAEVDELVNKDLNDLSLVDTQYKTPVSSAGTRSVSPSSLRSQQSAESAGASPPTSPAKLALTPRVPVKQSERADKNSTGSHVPQGLQPLLNYILWRIHQEVDPVAALESFIFLCNDQTKVNYAKGFEIKTKRLEHMREAIGREDRDYKNHQMLLNRENQNAELASPTFTSSHAEQEEQEVHNSDDDNEVIFRSPPRAPAAMISNQTQSPVTNIIDPDAFGRNPMAISVSAQIPAEPRSPRPQNSKPAPGSGRGGLQPPFAPRGNNTGRGGFHRGGGGSRGRGNFPGNGNRGGSSFSGNKKNLNARIDPESSPNAAQIDPDSFTRPRGDSAGPVGRGGRKLWVPT